MKKILLALAVLGSTFTFADDCPKYFTAALSLNNLGCAGADRVGEKQNLLVTKLNDYDFLELVRFHGSPINSFFKDGDSVKTNATLMTAHLKGLGFVPDQDIQYYKLSSGCKYNDNRDEVFYLWDISDKKNVTNHFVVNSNNEICGNPDGLTSSQVMYIRNHPKIQND